MPRRAAPRPADLLDPETHQESPIPSSSDLVAQNIARLRTHWKWAAFGQFFYTFSHLFAMEDVSLSDIEDDLARESNIFLPRVMARLLFVLSYDRKVSLDNWQSALRKQHKRRDPASNPIGPEPSTGDPEPRYRYESVSADGPTPGPADDAEDAADVDMDGDEKRASELPSGSRANTEEKDAPAPEQDNPDEEQHEEQQASTDWRDLPMLTKLDSMHLLTEWQFQNPTRLRTLMKSDDEDATWRIEPIGYDAKSNAYWLIGADRLWIQRAQPKPPRYTATTSPLKRKRPENATTKSSTAKSKRPAAKRPRLASESPKLTITVPGGGRAAKAQAKLKLDAQAKELAELNRAARAKPSRGRTAVAPVRPLGTRVSARLRGAEEDEWQAVPQDWLDEEKGPSRKTRAKTGLESDDESVSDLTELSEEPIDDAKEEDESSAEVPAVEEAAENNRDDSQPDGFVEWETICVTLSDWEHIAERFENGTHYTEKALHKVLVKQIVPVITEELREIERKRRLEEAIVHRKRSSRIANKESEKEEARLLAQQKAEVAEKKNRAQRLEARLAKEEAERERREAAREQRRRDKEAEEAQSAAAEHESADVVIDVVGNDPPPKQSTFIASDTSRRNGAATASASTSGTRTPMGDDWILNCEICHRSGVNADDGVPMFCCGLCSQWQHIACHDRADMQAGRPRRNWDQVEFVCRQCQVRRIAAKNSRQHHAQQQHAVPSSYLPQMTIAPPTSYTPYNHAPPPIAAHPPREYPGSYPVAVNGTAAYAHAQPNMGTSRQLPYSTPSPANYHQLMQPAPPRLSAGPPSNAQQQYLGGYDRSPGQFQHIAPNANGHRAPAPAYQRPVNGASGRMPQTGYNAPYPSSNGVSGRGDGERHQYGDAAQWHAGGSQQAAASGYRQY